MSTAKLSAYGSSTAVLGTGPNSLANATNSAAGSAYDNTSNLNAFGDFQLVLGTAGSARSSGATVDLYLVLAPDGTNYGDVDHATAELLASFPCAASTAAQRVVRRGIPLPPALMKFFVRNSTGQALNASGNTVTVFPFNVSIA